MKNYLQCPRTGNIFIMLSMLYFGFSNHASAQRKINGIVKDVQNLPIMGVTIVVKGQNKGAATDFDGRYTIDINNESTLVFSYLGFKKKEVTVTSQNTIDVVMEEDSNVLDEIVVTGVFDRRTKMQSSVSISTLNAKQIEKVSVNSAADLLKNIPGVFVNSSLGEIRNTVYSRGVSAGSGDGASGYYYVSMQEDGLPVTNATFTNYGPDYFLRPDATLGRLEAVRGGTASILGNNAPGGIFNYVSKTGGNKFEGEIRGKYGLEGNGKNPYYRMDFNVGGPLTNDKSVTYNIGGFFRQNDGDRYPGYPMNNGGQIKANVVKTYKTGSLKLFTKYLDDHNAWNENLPTIGFSDPHYPEGISRTNSVLIPRITTDFMLNDGGEKKHYDSGKKVHSTDNSIGLNWDQNFGNGWKIENKLRYSDKRTEWNSTSLVFPFAVDSVIFYYLNGLIMNPGVYSFNDHATGAQIGSITNMYGNITVNSSNFPGGNIQPNSLYMNPLFFTDNRMKELINQFSISKKLKNMSFTTGVFYSKSELDRKDGSLGVAFTQMTYPTRITDISYVGALDGKTYQVTNPEGIVGGGSGQAAPINFIAAKQNQYALFFGHNWEISSKLNFDWGIRYENINFSGNNQISKKNDHTSAGGVDGNPLTLYDNAGGAIVASYAYSDQRVSTFSFSGGLNYKFENNQAVYARVSQGSKAPDMGMFTSINTQFSIDHLDPISQHIFQLEMGYKLKAGNANLFVTPYYSVLSNVPQRVIGQETAEISSQYNTPNLYNKYRTYGVELEGIYDFTERLTVRAVATFQNSKAVDYKTWNLGANGSADDSVTDYSGNTTDNTPPVILRISPSYTTGKFYSSFDFSYMGAREANMANAFKLPAYNMTNLNLGYNLTKKLQLLVNINNLFNQNGVMGWARPGGFPAVLDSQSFTKEQAAANPNAVYSTTSLPTRAYYLTAAYKF